jgi:hypothetical protein
MNSNQNKVLFNPTISIKTVRQTLLSIYKIELNEDFTRIDFIYQAPSYCINGGWIQMERNAFIRPSDSTTNY